MDYKKLIKQQKNRFFILSLLKFVPSRIMLRVQYRIKFGRKLNLNNPKRWTEQLQVYKLKYRNPVLKACSDKLLVRDYVKNKGLEHILVKLYYIIKNPIDLEFISLPDSFVIKTTNGSGTNIFCKDVNDFDKNSAVKKLKSWIKRDYYMVGREWAYKDASRKIIIEELLIDSSNQFNGINDYKFLCFNGIPKYVVVDVDRHIGHKRNIYDMDWNKVDVSTDYPNIPSEVQKPEKFNEMVGIASKLSEDFPFVRVDLYFINNTIYFGELTFYPWTGYVQFNPDSFDYVLGENKII